MRCRDIEEIVHDLVDGELGLCARGRLRVHLCICQGCRIVVDKVRTLQRSLRSLDETDVAEDEPSLARALSLAPNSRLLAESDDATDGG